MTAFVPALLHIHGQPQWHDTAYIVGNTAGLTALRDAIDAALTGPERGEATVMTNDGEGFGVQVVLDDSDWEARWTRRALPYTEEIAAEHGDPDRILWPWMVDP